MDKGKGDLTIKAENGRRMVLKDRLLGSHEKKASKSMSQRQWMGKSILRKGG